MKTWLLLLPIALLFGVRPATEHQLAGTVTNERGEILIGASIIIKGTAQGTISDLNGTFTLASVDSCTTLVISYTGFETAEVAACSGTPLVVKLRPGAMLDEVVVTGLGTRKERQAAETPIKRPATSPKSEARRSHNNQEMAPPPPPAVAYDQLSYTRAQPTGQLLGTPAEPTTSEGYATIQENGFIPTSQENTSTFSIDVDAASYSNTRRFLNEGQLPPKDAVRSEEMINYFQYNYPPPTGEHPVQVVTEMATCPWQEGHQLLLVGMRAASMAKADLPAANFVFLLDVSGSMLGADRLPLLVESLQLLTDNLREQDRVAIVVYAGAAGQVLESTSGADKNKIKEALSRLRAGGSTAGAAGIQQAYDVARANFVAGGNNRVILATDGDFNVGLASNEELEALIVKERASGVFLSILGFGRGNLQDEKMETLADKGNGNYAYIDQLNEAKKVLVNEFGGTLFTVAKDVKIQVDFNPDLVASYRLVGYENRLLHNEDFTDDTKDAGELGAGHTITALYEIVPVARPDVSQPTTPALVKMRYKLPTSETSRQLDFPVRLDHNDWAQSSTDLRWAAAVAEFGMLLRDSAHKGIATYEHCAQIARQALGRDPFGYRQEMVRLVAKAEQLTAAVATH